MPQIILPDTGLMNIYDENSAHRLAEDTHSGKFRGYSGRNYDAHPYGAMPWENFPVPVIPRSEWSDRIKECNAKKLFSLHHHQLQKVPIMDQGRTNYCWINSVVGAIMNARARNGYPTVNLSSASAGAPGKKYKNVGGWTGEAIGYIGKYGLATHANWGNAVIDQSRFAPTREEAKLYGIGQWWELRSKRFDEIATCLLLGFDVVVGLQWWGHSVRYNALVEIGRNAFGVVAVNSWGPNWESGGMTVLAESKANADEANCITTGKPSGDSAAKLKADVDRLRTFADQLEIEG